MTEQEIYQYIEMTPFRGHEPVFRNTNITVAHIIDDFAKGLKETEILKQHSELSEKHIQAAFVFCQIAIKEADLAKILLEFG
jgi:uncharacterized protein (DUF433 family)